MIFDYITIFIFGIVAGLAASIVPGPIGVLCIQRTLSRSQRAGFFSGLGATTADTFFAALAIFALSWIEGFIAEYNIWVKVISGLVIMLFGLSIFVKKVKRPTGIKNGAATSDWSNYFSVLFLTLPNLAYFLVFTFLFSAMGVGSTDMATAQKWILVLGVPVGACGWWIVLTFAVDKFRKKFSIRSLWWMNKISGGAIVIFGAYSIIIVIYNLIKMLIDSGALNI